MNTSLYKLCGALHLVIKKVGDALNELLESGKPTSLGLSPLNCLPKFFLPLLNLGELVGCGSHGRDIA